MNHVGTLSDMYYRSERVAQTLGHLGLSQQQTLASSFLHSYFDK
jgi:hypothetical protein